MPKKHAEIDSLEIDDTNALFTWICKEALNMGVVKAKATILKYSRSNSMRNKVPAWDLMKVIKAAGIRVSIKVECDGHMNGDWVFVNKEDKFEATAEQSIESFKGEITDPEFKEIVNNAVPEAKESASSHPIDGNNIPAPDFI